MDWMISVAQLLLSLSFLVAVHEFGHLIAAKYFGMRVEQFSIGFPPKIWSFKKGETEYALSAIPLGGYVKISGMIDESLDTETMKMPPQPWEFRSKPAWQRLIVMLGGIIVNLTVGILIFIGITFAFGDTYLLKDKINEKGGFDVGTVGETVGLKTGDKIVAINGRDFKYIDELIKPQTLLGTDLTYTVERDGKPVEIKIPGNFIENFNKKENHGQFIGYRIPAIVGVTVKEAIAADVGLKEGDIMVDVNNTPVRYADEVRDLVRSTPSDTLSFSISRNGEVLRFREPFKKQKDEEDGQLKVVKQIGIMKWKVPEHYLDDAEVTIKYSFIESIPLGFNRAFETLATQIIAFKRILSGALSFRKSLSGPLGIMQAFGLEWDWERFWSLTGVLSLVLAFMNLLPIPALDGGHVMFLTYEMVSRRKPSDKFLETAQKIGMVFLLGLMLFIITNDIIKMIT
jgi:regulator of sigma E protease